MRETTGDDERRSRWKHKVHKVYRKQIRDKVGNTIPPIESRKALKVPSPEVYDGSPDVDVFERWLMSLLQWMVVNRMCGDACDATRTTVLGMFLQGKALDWYNDEVAGIHRTVRKWTFEGAIMGVFDRCIQATTIHQAARQFNLIEYSPDTGVRDYYSSLTRWASRMLQKPDNATMQKRFIEGLPFNIIRQLTNEGIVPEYAKLEVMVRAVARIEDRMALTNYYVSSRNRDDEQSSEHPDESDTENIGYVLVPIEEDTSLKIGKDKPSE
jgi:hypothetical protein